MRRLRDRFRALDRQVLTWLLGRHAGRLPREVEPLLRRNLERAAASCPVHRSLADHVEIEVRFAAGESGGAG